MPIKSTSQQRCLKHQEECTYNCGWCGKPICEGCVEAAHGKKYCEKCWNKKQSMRSNVEVDSLRGSAPSQPIRNVDHSLDPKIAEQHRTTGELWKRKSFE